MPALCVTRRRAEAAMSPENNTESVSKWLAWGIRRDRKPSTLLSSIHQPHSLSRIFRYHQLNMKFIIPLALAGTAFAASAADLIAQLVIVKTNVTVLLGDITTFYGPPTGTLAQALVRIVVRFENFLL